jgi:hypothetical protein
MNISHCMSLESEQIYAHLINYKKKNRKNSNIKQLSCFVHSTHFRRLFTLQ